MSQFGKIRRIASSAVAGLIVSACAVERDAASEAPVDPAPGLYEITLSGAGPLKAGGKEGPHSYCLKRREQAAFPHLLVKNFYTLHGSCRQKRAPREGNKIGGEISCSADPKLAAGFSRFIYDGAVSLDDTEVEVQIKLDAAVKKETMTEEEAAQLRLGMKMMERMRFVIKATRNGDCR